MGITIVINHLEIGHFRGIREEMQLARFHFTKVARFKASLYFKVL